MPRCLDPIIIGFPCNRMVDCSFCPHRQDESCWRGVVRLETPVRYELDGGRTLTVKPGFCFDGASIPQAAWSIIGHPYEPQFIQAALLHDAIYHSHAMSKEEADGLFREMLNKAGVGYLKRMLMARAVQAFGGSSYRGAPAEHWQRFVEMSEPKQ